MEITKNMFNKLKQLDRIEYRQRFLLLHTTSTFFLSMETLMFAFCMVCIAIGSLISYVYAIVFFIGGASSLLLLHKQEKELDKLNKDYFKIKTKK